MVYELQLKWTALAVALLLALSALPGLVVPATHRRVALGLARNDFLGTVLLAAAALWALWLVRIVDIGEFSVYRGLIQIFIVALAVSTSIFLRDYIASRAVGILLLLGAEVLLSAAFPHETLWKLPVVLLAYGWAVAGMFFVAAPQTFRDWNLVCNADETRTKLASSTTLGFAATLAALAFAAY